MRLAPFLLLAVPLTVALADSKPAWAMNDQCFTPTPLEPRGASNFGAAAINNRGQIVGVYSTPAGAARAILTEDGVMIDLGTLGGSQAHANAINDKGVVVGSSLTEDGPTGRVHACLWRDRAILDIGVGLGPASEARGLNEHGDIVGSVTVAAHEQHAFLWRRDGARIDLGTFGGPMGQAFAVNKHGQIVGVSSTPEGRNHAFLWEGGRMRDLGTLPGGTMSHAISINDRGQIVGVADVAGGFFRAFLWENGVMRDLGTLGGASSDATSINQAGEISGSATISLTSGEVHAAIWREGQWTDIGAQLGPGIHSVGYQMNDKGQVVGMGFNFRDAFQFHPFLWSPGRCR